MNFGPVHFVESNPAAEEQIVTERLRRKLNEVNTASQTQLSHVQDNINFTLQQSYFKCAYECLDRSRTQDEINTCVENCSVPILRTQNPVETEMAKFQSKQIHWTQRHEKLCTLLGFS
ncbi:protein FAM136A-like [Camellia sinensis]|uniref:protein FAM136A-like n=1 Tax=Camellia sinensis TaxID=4442 RepID=UPI00103639BD|nr:protein FAM136A-like [Camellia sinensis]